jgi:hypothetical protein
VPSPPGSGTLVREFARLRRRVDELSRKTPGTEEILLTWRSMYHNSGTFSVPDNTVTNVSGWLDEPDAPTNSTSEIQYASGIFTVARAGLYLVNLQLAWSVGSSVTGRFSARLDPSGSAGVRVNHIEKHTTGVATFANPDLSTIFYLDAGGTVEGQAVQISGAARTLTSGTGLNFFAIRRLEPY